MKCVNGSGVGSLRGFPARCGGVRCIVRTALGFLSAALAPALLVSAWYLYRQFMIFEPDDTYIWFSTRGFLLLYYDVALGFVLVLGVPLFFVLRYCGLIRWWSVLLSGFALAAIPMGIYTWPMKYPNLNATVNGVPTIVNGVPTLEGWIQFGQGVVVFGCYGLGGALAVWLVAPNKSNKAQPSAAGTH